MAPSKSAPHEAICSGIRSIKGKVDSLRAATEKAADTLKAIVDQKQPRHV